MPCIEPTMVYPPKRMDWADGLANVFVTVLSRLAADRGGHYLVPAKNPVAVLEIRHERHLKSAIESWGPAVEHVRTHLAEADRRFGEVTGILDKAQRRDKDSGGPGSTGGTDIPASDWGAINTHWRCVSQAMNALHREQAQMLCAIDNARSSYIWRQDYPEDPCDDCERDGWVAFPGGDGHPHHDGHGMSEREKVTLAELALKKSEDELREARSEVDRLKGELDECRRKYDQQEYGAAGDRAEKDASDADQTTKGPATRAEGADQTDRRGRKKPA